MYTYTIHNMNLYCKYFQKNVVPITIKIEKT